MSIVQLWRTVHGGSTGGESRGMARPCTMENYFHLDENIAAVTQRKGEPEQRSESSLQGDTFEGQEGRRERCLLGAHDAGQSAYRLHPGRHKHPEGAHARARFG